MQRFHLHLVSDATGETLSSVAKAALAQFEGFDAMEHMHAMIRSPKQMELALAAIQRMPGLVLYTLVDRELRAQLEEGCRSLGFLSIACGLILDTVTRGRREMKLLAYLALRAPGEDRRRS